MFKIISKIVDREIVAQDSKRSSWSPYKFSCSSTMFLADTTADSLQYLKYIDLSVAISPTSDGISSS